MKNSHSRTAAGSETTPDAFLADLRTFVAEAQKLLEASPGENENHAELAVELRERFEAARDRFNEIYSTAKKKVVAGGKYADETIRSNPYQSIAVAAGIGLVIGILVGRRGK